MSVPWFERMNLWSVVLVVLPMTILLGVDVGDRAVVLARGPRRRCRCAARRSMPVPISGASVFSSGTAWRCMFEPISARLASSCSRNGISAVATDQIWSGETSIRSTSFGAASMNSPSRERHVTCGPLSLLVFGSISAFAWAMTFSSSSVRVEVDDLVGDDAVLDDPVRGRDEAVLGDLGVATRASRSGRCSGPPASRSGTCGRSGSGGRRGPRWARARA